MVQFINRKPSLGEMLGQNVVSGLGGYLGRQRDLSDQERALAQQYGLVQQKADLDLRNKLEEFKGKKDLNMALLGSIFGDNRFKDMMPLDESQPSNLQGTSAIKPTNTSLMPEKTSTLQKVALSVAGYPQEARLIQTAEQDELNRLEKERQYQFEQQKFADKKETQNWDYSKKYLEQLDQGVEDSLLQLEVADEFERLVKSGNIAPGVTPSGLRNFLAGKFGENFPFLFTADTSAAKFLEKLQAKGLKQYFPRPTEAEFFFINAAQAQLGKSNEANLSVINLQKKFASIPLKAAEIKDEIIRQNGGSPPRDLQSQVNNRMKDFTKSLIKESAEITYNFGDQQQKKESIDFFKQKLPSGRILIELPDGRLADIPKEQQKLAEEQGYKIL